MDRTVPRSVYEAVFTLKEGSAFVTQGASPTELIIVQLDRIDRPAPSELDLLAPVSEPIITEQLNQDLLVAFELEVQNAMDVEVKQGDYQIYKQRLINDQ